jgi:hypothetical protein
MRDIWGLIRRAAADIPLDVESEMGQERALTEVMECCTAGLSPVVVDDKQAIVGALLAKRDQFDWGFLNAETINVSIAAVAATHRDQGVLKMLIEEIIRRNAPVFVEVKSDEENGLRAQLRDLGFSLKNAGANGELYQWEPVAQTAL